MLTTHAFPLPFLRKRVNRTVLCHQCRHAGGQGVDAMNSLDATAMAALASLVYVIWLEESNATHRNTGLLVQIETRVAVRLGGGTSAVGEVRGAGGESRSSGAWGPIRFLAAPRHDPKTWRGLRAAVPPTVAADVLFYGLVGTGPRWY